MKTKLSVPLSLIVEKSAKERTGTVLYMTVILNSGKKCQEKNWDCTVYSSVNILLKFTIYCTEIHKNV